MQNAFQLCWNENQRFGDNKKQNNTSSSHVVKSRPPSNYKTGHFKLFNVRKRPRNVRD